MEEEVALQGVLRSGEIGMLMQQDVGFILVKDLAQSQEDNLERKRESGEVIVTGG